MSDNCLYKRKKEDYGDTYQQHLFEQYKLYVEGTEKVSDRRAGANRYFITINTAILTAIIISFKIDVIGNTSHIVSISLSFLGIVICIVFYFLLRSYRQLNARKFDVIHEIEENLPLKLYAYEWKALGEGKKKEIYLPFSRVEPQIPRILGAAYLVCFAVLLLTELF